MRGRPSSKVATAGCMKLLAADKAVDEKLRELRDLTMKRAKP